MNNFFHALIAFSFSLANATVMSRDLSFSLFLGKVQKVYVVEKKLCEHTIKNVRQRQRYQICFRVTTNLD